MTERDQEKHYNQIAESDFHISCGVHFLRLAERLMLFLFMIIIKWVRGPIMAPVSLNRSQDFQLGVNLRKLRWFLSITLRIPTGTMFGSLARAKMSACTYTTKEITLKLSSIAK